MHLYYIPCFLRSLQSHCKDRYTPIIKRLTINYAQRAKELKHGEKKLMKISKEAMKKQIENIFLKRDRNFIKEPNRNSEAESYHS